MESKGERKEATTAIKKGGERRGKGKKKKGKREKESNSG